MNGWFSRNSSKIWDSLKIIPIGKHQTSYIHVRQFNWMCAISIHLRTIGRSQLIQQQCAFVWCSKDWYSIAREHWPLLDQLVHDEFPDAFKECKN